jgi:hypothetical protein
MSSDPGLKFFYGDYEHLPGEVYPSKIEVIPKFTPDGLRWGNQWTFRVKGNFVDVEPELNPAGVNAKITAIYNAYHNNYKDVGFRLPDGSLTHHYMRNADRWNLSGNRVVYRSWDHQTPTEFANTRSFSIGISALWRHSESDIISWNESTERTGTGGPIREARATWNGVPYMYTIAAQSKVVHIQQGEVVSFDDWVEPPPPYWPDEELVHLRVIQQNSPRFWGDPSFSKPTHFVLRYKYVFQRVGPTPVRPRNWYGT